ncbi:hypothetical protein XENORESO_006264 [Xenotaenia resolanae]|uniref:Uncharacterized protein n=1 Tax=Xenotaenia resolanae TaxID=208358 RepID=A0ABV0VP85_9TELE
MVRFFICFGRAKTSLFEISVPPNNSCKVPPLSTGTFSFSSSSSSLATNDNHGGWWQQKIQQGYHKYFHKKAPGASFTARKALLCSGPCPSSRERDVKRDPISLSNLKNIC